MKSALVRDGEKKTNEKGKAHLLAAPLFGKHTSQVEACDFFAVEVGLNKSEAIIFHLAQQSLECTQLT